MNESSGNSDLAGRGLVVSAPASGSGKTLLTLGLLRAIARSGQAVVSAKAGPDYIDPQFHAHASGGPCVNLDPWAMRPDLIRHLAAVASARVPVLIEGMMGLFDAASDGHGSVADLAAALRLPVLLIVDAARQSHSVAAVVEGFANHREDVTIAGVVLNRVASDRHEKMLRQAMARTDVPLLGLIRRQADLSLPERHLGLVQAGEHSNLEAFIERAAGIIGQSVDLPAVMDAFSPLGRADHPAPARIAPPGNRIAIARDMAFAFSYPHIIDGWRQQGAVVSFFSPLADEPPDTAADAIYLPGGYPELHAGRLAGSQTFMQALQARAAAGTPIYGECGGYMVLGEELVDADGRRHKMAGLLPLATSFENPGLHLGYRILQPAGAFFPASRHETFNAHEFHYASVLRSDNQDALFRATDPLGGNVENVGHRRGNVMGSFMHIIDLRNGAA